MKGRREDGASSCAAKRRAADLPMAQMTPFSAHACKWMGFNALGAQYVGRYPPMLWQPLVPAQLWRTCEWLRRQCRGAQFLDIQFFGTFTGSAMGRSALLRAVQAARVLHQRAVSTGQPAFGAIATKAGESVPEILPYGGPKTVIDVSLPQTAFYGPHSLLGPSPPGKHMLL